MAGFVLPIISGLAGLFGSKPKPVTTTTNTNATQNTQASTQGTTHNQITPDLSPLQQRLSEMFATGAAKLNNPADLTGYTQGGLSNINAGADAATQAIRSSLAKRGLSYSPVAGTAETQNTINRVNQGTQFLSQVPLVQRQMQQQGIDELIKAFGVLPTGTTQDGTSSGNTTGTQTSTGTSTSNQTGGGSSPFAGLLSGLGAGLAGPNSSGEGNNLDSILQTFGYGKGK